MNLYFEQAVIEIPVGQVAQPAKRVIQFLSEGRYVANVVDGEVTLYGGRQ